MIQSKKPSNYYLIDLYQTSAQLKFDKSPKQLVAETGTDLELSMG